MTLVTQDSSAEETDVTVEVWNAEPPRMEGAGKTRQAVLELDSGLLEVNPLVEDEAEWLDVGGPGTYRLRAHATGQCYVFRFWR